MCRVFTSAATAHPGRRRAFTRIEAVALLATLSLLACVALPGLANSRPRSERVLCVNNLRQVGQTFQTWATDHGEMNPWWVPATRLPTGSFDPDAGTQGHPFDSQPWFQLSWVSNQLGTPKILACPADTEVWVAGLWSDDPIEGFLNAYFRNNAVSYFLGLHALPDYPQSILCGDRNLTVNSLSYTGCETGIKPTAVLNAPYARNGWTDRIHAGAGNLLLTSGSVVQTSPPILQSALLEATPPYSALHALFPRPPQLVPQP